MFSDHFHRQSYVYLFYVLSFLLPLHRMIIPYAIALIILNWLLEGKFRKKYKLIRSSRSRQQVLCFASLYVFYLIGLIYSSNFFGQEGALFDIQVKLSLIVFPLIFATLPEDSLNFKIRIIAMKLFVAGCFVAILICFASAIIDYINTGYKHEFYYTYISFFMHPSYFSMYLNVAIAILFYSLFFDDQQKTKIYIIILVFLCCCFVIFNILLSSKAGLIGMGILITSTVMYMAIWKKMLINAILLAAITFIIVVAFLKILPYSTMRMNTVKEVVKKEQISEKEEVESSAERLLVWGVAWEIIKGDFIIGAGTGDVKHEMLEKYKERNYNSAVALRLNAHNQYLQTFIAIGFIGFIVLVMSLLLPLIYSYKKQDYIYFMFLILIMFNFLVESMLETQAGVVFYSFMNILLFSTVKVNKL